MSERANMNGKICVVTGANSGIGKETALGLAQMGARVVMVSRSAEKGKAALEDVRRESGNSQVDLLIADMSSQASVRELGKTDSREVCAARRADQQCGRGRAERDNFRPTASK